jgi:predicted amidohydrolase YtcJ
MRSIGWLSFLRSKAIGCGLFPLLFLFHPASANANTNAPADTLFVNGKIVRFDEPVAAALAVRAGRIVAIGSEQELREQRGPETRVIDLAGRTVIPGLIDSHIHAIRAGLTYEQEVSWIGARSLTEALQRLRQAASTRPAGSWLIVAGGWTEAQCIERRRPTQDELVAAAPQHLIYLQRLYTSVFLSPKAMPALGLFKHPELASRLKVETDSSGQASGWLSGDARSISDVYDLLPRPDRNSQLVGTQAFFRELNSYGLTGVLDPGGYNLPVSAYQALFQLWREGGLSLRVAYSVCAPRRDHELEDLATLTALLPVHGGDDWLRYNGIGENAVWGMYNNDAPTAQSRERMRQVLRWAAMRGETATFHWNNNRSVDALLAVIEEINRETAVGPLRWSIAHLNDASDENLQRMKALGMGWLVQDALYYRGEDFRQQLGPDAIRRTPPIRQALQIGVVTGGGTDAHRVMSHKPFTALQWLLDGKTVAGQATRDADHLLTRIEALRLFTSGSAWFSFDENNRGELKVGLLADLAVLSHDYLTMAVEQIGTIRSVLTMVGGKVVYASDEYAGLEEKLADLRNQMK